MGIAFQLELGVERKWNDVSFAFAEKALYVWASVSFRCFQAVESVLSFPLRNERNDESHGYNWRLYRADLTSSDEISSGRARNDLGPVLNCIYCPLGIDLHPQID